MKNRESSGAVTASIGGVAVGGVAVYGVVTYAPVTTPAFAAMDLFESIDDAIPQIITDLEVMEPSIEDVTPRQVGRVMNAIRQLRRNLMHSFDNLSQAQCALTDAAFPEAERVEAEALAQTVTDSYSTHALEVDQLESRVDIICQGILDSLQAHAMG